MDSKHFSPRALGLMRRELLKKKPGDYFWRSDIYQNPNLQSIGKKTINACLKLLQLEGKLSAEQRYYSPDVQRRHPRKYYEVLA